MLAYFRHIAQKYGCKLNSGEALIFVSRLRIIGLANANHVQLDAGFAFVRLLRRRGFMKKTRWFLGFLAVLITVGSLAGCAEVKRGLDVVASFYPMADFAGKIGGDRVHVTTMVPSGTEPHDWEPSPTDIVNLTKASVFVFNGAGMEHWVGDVLNSLDNKNLTVIEASKGVALLDEGAQADPHVWLNPMNAKIEMGNIRDALVSADPAGKDTYEANYNKYAAELDALDAEYKTALASAANRDLVVAHAAYGYLCDAYGLNQVAIEGLSPDSEPDPARVAEIIDFAKAHSVKVIFFESLVSPKVAQSIADQVGAQTSVLNPLEGLTDEEIAAGDDYFSVMRKNLTAIQSALK
jgi:zinc transport system substrate-binding protein